MKQYQSLLKEILKEGVRQPNRTGIDTITIPGAMMRFDLREGFPIVTTKKIPFKAGIGEMIGFLQGKTNAEEFKELGCNWWNANANENLQWLENPHRKGTGDLGRIYGAQWRSWQGQNMYIDQVGQALYEIVHNPTSRRIIISGWNPDDLHKMALPPCHLLYQFLVDTVNKELHLCMYQRSADTFLGVPINIMGSAFMLHLFARLTGYRPARFTHFLADVHIYVNHLEQVDELLGRTPMDLPTLEIDDAVPTFESNGLVVPALCALKPSDFRLVGYQSHPPIRGDMAV